MTVSEIGGWLNKASSGDKVAIEEVAKMCMYLEDKCKTDGEHEWAKKFFQKANCWIASENFDLKKLEESTAKLFFDYFTKPTVPQPQDGNNATMTYNNSQVPRNSFGAFCIICGDRFTLPFKPNKSTLRICADCLAKETNGQDTRPPESHQQPYQQPTYYQPQQYQPYQQQPVYQQPWQSPQPQQTQYQTAQQPYQPPPNHPQPYYQPPSTPQPPPQPQNGFKFCAECGTKNASDSCFCIDCGAKFS